MTFRVLAIVVFFLGFASSVACAQDREGMQGYVENIKTMMASKLYEPLSIQTTAGKRFDFKIELADTPSKAMNGLMNRKSMPAENGMLFLFSDGERERTFWMRNTLIPLDILFIRSDGIIHRIHDSAQPLDETYIKSKGDVCCVLELNGGIAKSLGIQAGDRVVHRVFRNNLAK